MTVPAKVTVEVKDGLPGTITETGLILKPNLSIQEWSRALGLLGGMGRGLSWWVVDAIEYGESHFGESAAQYVDTLGLTPARLSTLCWVGRRWPRSRRRDDMSFGHHEALAALPEPEQDRWMAQAAQGDHLPNGEKRRWSVTTLRQKLRALNVTTSPETAPVTIPGLTVTVEPAVPESTVATAFAVSPDEPAWPCRTCGCPGHPTEEETR